MKKILIVVFVSFYNFSLFAECLEGGIRVFPDGNEIVRNSIIMIEGFAFSQETVVNLRNENHAYLISGDHIVQLDLLDIYKGEYSSTQAILKPQEELIAGNEYVLKIDSLSRFDQTYKIRTYGKPVSWKIKNEIDKRTPSWKAEMRPKLLNTSYIRYGCGPAVFAHFQVKINDASEVLVKTEVMDLKNNETTIYYLSSRDGKIDVGHGMCSGAFSFSKNGKYKVRFDLMDASGNSFGRWSEWTAVSGFQTKMGILDFSKTNNLPLQIGVILFFMAIFFKRHSQKV